MTLCQNFSDLLFDVSYFANKSRHSLVDFLIRAHDLTKDVEIHLSGSRSVIVVGLDELKLGTKSSVFLLDAAMRFFLFFLNNFLLVYRFL